MATREEPKRNSKTTQQQTPERLAAPRGRRAGCYWGRGASAITGAALAAVGVLGVVFEMLIGALLMVKLWVPVAIGNAVSNPVRGALGGAH
eukprot:6289671-Lingulodinium_polyedra.AAC.1